MHSFLALQLDRMKRASIYLLAMVIRTFTKVEKKRIFMWSYHFDKYACNPRAFTEYLLENCPNEYEIYWAFIRGKVPVDLNPCIHVVEKYSFAYLKALYTSKYVITNLRNDKMDTMFKKKKGQKYIMTWHSSIRLKKIEKDAAIQLGGKYVKKAIEDSRMCDLMLSNSRMFTDQLRSSFWYEGEILEKCIPRNSIFYDENKKVKAYRKVRELMGFPSECKIVLYAPTFRGNNEDLRFYQIDWDKVIIQFRKILGGEVRILLRLHPNMSHVKDLSSITGFENVYDITQAPDIVEFMLAADAMISDYTSAMFDSIILDKPCFIYAIDKDEYDRGFYWQLESLPFPLAVNSEELVKNIAEFNVDVYRERVERFRKDFWGLEEDGRACERLYEWLRNN